MTLSLHKATKRTNTFIDVDQETSHTSIHIHKLKDKRLHLNSFKIALK